MNEGMMNSVLFASAVMQDAKLLSDRFANGPLFRVSPSCPMAPPMALTFFGKSGVRLSRFSQLNNGLVVVANKAWRLTTPNLMFMRRNFTSTWRW